jgi:hypothetical protein
MGSFKRAICAVMVTVILVGVVQANWSDSFDGGTFGLTTWKWLSYPQVKNTYTQTVLTTADGNSYLALKETTPASSSALGAAFGIGFGSEEKFTDVRVAATVNVTGDASHNYYGLATRSSYVINDGKMVPGAAPGIVASCYIMHVNWQNGPANLQIDIEKVVNLQNIMRTDFDVYVPGVAHARSYYAALDVVGSDPVYVQGSLYEFKGGPLVAQTAVMIDTNGNDPWEDPDQGCSNKVFTTGPSGIFAQNERENPPGFYTTFDDISSVSDGPPAMLPSPASGAAGVSMQATLSWLEAKYATGRQLWLGTPGDLQLVDPAPQGTTYTTGLLEPGQTYQWRVDLVGAAGTVTGHTWTFTTGAGLTIDDFESYADSPQVFATWVDNIPDVGFDYAYLETATVNQGKKAMRFEYQNQYDPFLTEATRTFAAPQDWTVKGVDMLTLMFRGKRDNVEQPLYVRLEDAAGKKATVVHVARYAVQSEPWRAWDIPLAEFSTAGVDLKNIKKLTIGVGEGKTSGQADKDFDTIYLDNIRLGFLPTAP